MTRVLSNTISRPFENKHICDITLVFSTPSCLELSTYLENDMYASTNIQAPRLKKAFLQ